MTPATRAVSFLAYCTVVTLAQSRALYALFDLSQHDASSSHLVIVPLVTLALLGVDRRPIASAARTALGPGLGLIFTGAVFWFGLQGLNTERVTDLSLTVDIAATVVWLIGGFLLFYGRQALRIAMFPLLFLIFAIPAPKPLLVAVTFVLKTGSTEVVSALFNVLGTPHHREGFVFTLPNVVIQVADECSGIRSSIALLLTSAVAGHLFLRHTWAKIILAIAIVPLAILKNGLRIVILGLLAVYVDPAFLTGQLHHEGGVLFFLLALAGMSVVLALLRTWDGPTTIPA